MSKMQKDKKFSLVLIKLLLFLIPSFIVLIIIGNHSNYLIKDYLVKLLIIFLGIYVFLLIFGIYKYFKNKKAKYEVKKIKKIISNILIIIYILGCFVFIFLLYGPTNTFKDWLITTAMKTMNHQYYCKWFYNDEDINNVLNNNYIIEVDEDTDPNLIYKEKEDVTYENEYEKAILEKDEDNDLYKIIKFKVNGCNAYLGVIYDASKVSVAVSKWVGSSGQFVTQMAKDNEAVLAINGGGFYDPNYSSNGASPLGVTISHGKIITSYGYDSTSGGIIGLTNDNVLVLLRGNNAEEALKKGVRDAVTMAPFLIVNGKNSYIKGNGGWGYAARTAIGQREDGIILFLVVDSNATRTNGADMKNLADIMEKYGAINAANLDGGTSTVMVHHYEIINDPINGSLAHATRAIPTAFILKENK